MFFERLILFSYRWILEKPTYWISAKILFRIENQPAIKNQIRQIGKWASHLEETISCLDASERKHFRKTYSCSQKRLEKGAEACAEIILLFALSIMPISYYIWKISQGDKEVLQIEEQTERLMRLLNTFPDNTAQVKDDIHVAYEQQKKVDSKYNECIRLIEKMEKARN